MAIIVVVTVSTIINTIADARVNSIWNLAKATANTYDNLVAQDMLSSEKKLKGIELTNGWKCINALKNDKNVQLKDILELSGTDLVLGGVSSLIPRDLKQMNDSEPYCSAIRLRDNGNVEVLLIATPTNGKFSISGKVVYALSSADNGGTNKKS